MKVAFLLILLLLTLSQAAKKTSSHLKTSSSSKQETDNEEFTWSSILDAFGSSSSTSNGTASAIPNISYKPGYFKADNTFCKDKCTNAQGNLCGKNVAQCCDTYGCETVQGMEQCKKTVLSQFECKTVVYWGETDRENCEAQCKQAYGSPCIIEGKNVCCASPQTVLKTFVCGIQVK